AFAQAAAELGTVQFQVVAQYIEQRGIGFHVNDVRLLIDPQRMRAGARGHGSFTFNSSLAPGLREPWPGNGGSVLFASSTIRAGRPQGNGFAPATAPRLPSPGHAPDPNLTQLLRCIGVDTLKLSVYTLNY